MKKIIIVSILFVLFFSPVFVSAQGLKGALDNLKKVGGTGGESLGVSADLPTTVANVIKILLSLVGTIFLILTIYAGVLWMTAAGEKEKIEKAQSIIKASIIGLVIVLSAYAITAFVMGRLVG